MFVVCSKIDSRESKNWNAIGPLSSGGRGFRSRAAQSYCSNRRQPSIIIVVIAPPTVRLPWQLD